MYKRQLQDALLQILPALGEIEDQMTHYLSMFGQWLKRPKVTTELANLIAPDPDSDINLAILRAEFEVMDFDPESLSQPFDTVVDLLAGAFVNAAASQEELQGILGIRTARTMADILKAMAPLDLEELERNYLQALYKDCLLYTSRCV